MKKYNVCVESYISNNSDKKEYNNYYVNANSWNEANEYAIKCIENWNKNSKGVIYHIYNITPHN